MRYLKSIFISMGCLFLLSGYTLNLRASENVNIYIETGYNLSEGFPTLGPMTNINMDLPPGWSMISLPVLPLNPTASIVFPGARVIYGFDRETGYVRVTNNETLEVGKGYWILLEEAREFVLTGQSIRDYFLDVDESGWRMIGGCTSPALPSIESGAGNIVVIYGYVQGTGYERVRVLEGDNLERGKGYWISVSGPAKVIIESIEMPPGFDDLLALIDASSLPEGLKADLKTMVESASDAYDLGDNSTAIDLLKGFINEVRVCPDGPIIHDLIFRVYTILREVIVDTKPPEAIFDFNLITNEIEIFSIDNKDLNITLAESSRSEGPGNIINKTFTTADESGNRLSLDVEFDNGSDPGNWVQSKITEIRYNDSEGIVPVNNLYRAEFELDVGTGLLKLLHMIIYVQDYFNVVMTYDRQTNQTNITVTVIPQGNDYNYTFDGLYLMQLLTGNGDFGLSGAQTAACANTDNPLRGDRLIDWNSIINYRPPSHHSYVPPGFSDTSEYMMGTVAVKVILMESAGPASMEDWSAAERSNVQAEIQEALNWWQGRFNSQGFSLPASAKPNFIFDWTHLNNPIPTINEPINGPGITSSLARMNGHFQWIAEANAFLGFTAFADPIINVRQYLNNFRAQMGTDWAFVVFVIDSSNDTDGCFADPPPMPTPVGWLPSSAYAFLGGPFMIMTYDNDGWGIGAMNSVCAHETGHIFYATDEYNGITENSGFLNAPDTEGSNCLMDNNLLSLSLGTINQVGWRDNNHNSIPDILDTFPSATLNPYLPDPTTSPFVTYSGLAEVNPQTNLNPQDSGKDITLNTITKVEYRIDGGSWIPGAQALDGAFDSHTEQFTFTIYLPGSPSGLMHTIETRAFNSVNNTVASASDTLTVTGLAGSDTRLTTSTPLPSTTMANWIGDIGTSGNNIHIVWTEIVFTGQAGGLYNYYTIRYMRSTNGGQTWDDGLGNIGWTRNLSHYTTSSSCSRPRMALSGNHVHIVWTVNSQSNPSGNIIYMHSADNGFSWGFAKQLTNYSPQSGPGPFGKTVTEFDIDASGNNVYMPYILSIDNSQPGPGPVVYNFALYLDKSTDNGTSWLASPIKLSGDFLHMSGVSVASDNNNVHVVWADDRIANNYEIYYKRSVDCGATWSSDSRLTNDPGGTGMSQIAVSGTNLHLAWIDDRDGNKEVYYKRSVNNGDTWEPDARLTNNAVLDHIPFIAVNQNTVYLTRYSEQVPAPGQWGIHYIHSTDNGQSWSPDIPLVTIPTASPAYPSKIGITGSTVHIVWEDSRHTNASEIYYKGFQP
ncbi:MAG: hypothetical protein ACMUIU_10410 [bacterium]